MDELENESVTKTIKLFIKLGYQKCLYISYYEVQDGSHFFKTSDISEVKNFSSLNENYK